MPNRIVLNNNNNNNYEVIKSQRPQKLDSFPHASISYWQTDDHFAFRLALASYMLQNNIFFCLCENDIFCDIKFI